MEQTADRITRLMDVAARLRLVRRAQRRFLRLWARQRVRELAGAADRRDPQLFRNRRLFDD